jgi:hypothetical protein
MEVLAALAACRTTADFYRAQIDAENVMTPTEVEAAAADPALLPEPARAWIGKLLTSCTRVAPAMEAYRRRHLGENVMLFEGDGRPDAQRLLVVAFTGIGLRMMLPVSTFLQGFPAARCDVVVLRDPERVAFLRGVPGYAPDLPGLARRLAADLPMDRYAGTRCIGSSSGGAAALCLGSILGARVAMATGGAHPRGVAQRAAGTSDRDVFDGILAVPPSSRCRRISAFGDGYERDSVRGRLLAMASHGEVLAVRTVTVHGVLGGLAARRLLARFLAETLLNDGPAGEAWTP